MSNKVTVTKEFNNNYFLKKESYNKLFDVKKIVHDLDEGMPRSIIIIIYSIKSDYGLVNKV